MEIHNFFMILQLLNMVKTNAHSKKLGLKMLLISILWAKKSNLMNKILHN